MPTVYALSSPSATPVSLHHPRMWGAALGDSAADFSVRPRALEPPSSPPRVGQSGRHMTTAVRHKATEQLRCQGHTPAFTTLKCVTRKPFSPAHRGCLCATAPVPPPAHLHPETSQAHSSCPLPALRPWPRPLPPSLSLHPEVPLHGPAPSQLGDPGPRTPNLTGPQHPHCGQQALKCN